MPGEAIPTAASRIQFQPDNVRNGLAQLVLTVVELLRELLERQAIRRIDAGSLADGDIERLGTTFFQLAAEMEKLKAYFGLKDEDLNLDLGPLGKLR
jgi:hypothetical protein